MKNNTYLSTYQSTVLETLSFYEYLSKEQIILDMDVAENSSITLADLEDALIDLKKKKLVKEKSSNGQTTWKRIYPKDSLIKKLRRLF